MSQFPPTTPPVPGAFPPPVPQRRTSGAAVGSLVCGILGCLVITPILAIILGIVGMSQTKGGAKGGRALAVIGLILGIVWLLGFAGCGGGIYTFYVASKPVAAVAQGFMSDLAAGNTAGALARCESSITKEEIESMATSVKGYGAYKDLTLPARHSETVGGVTKWELIGVAEFANSNEPVHFTLHKQGDGSYKIVSAEIRPGAKPSTQSN